MILRLAEPRDLLWLAAHDHHISQDRLAVKIGQSEIYVAEDGGLRGWLRYGLFWDNLPFMNLLRVLDGHQKRGIGTSLVLHWEAEMKQLGHDNVLTSTLSDENAQHFYRKLGYRDTGGFVLPGEALELVFFKDLGAVPQKKRTDRGDKNAVHEE